MLIKQPPFGYLFKKIRLELLYVAILTFIVYTLATTFQHLIPDLPLAIPTFLGTAISVILSFKLSQSYDRWWEARKIWGSIVNDSRNLVLQLQNFVKPGNAGTIKRIAYRHMGWCYCLGQSLRGLEPLNGLERFLSPAELNDLGKHTNKPLGILQLNNREITELHQQDQIDTFSNVQLNNTMVSFVNQMGMSERIKSTVFPVTYRVFLHMIIYVFVVTLTISMRRIEGHFQLPLLLVVSSFFFLLERTATLLQDPFSNRPTDTSMTAIATTIEINIKQLIGEEDVPKPHQPDGYYLN
jgi:putative membrane protein